MLTNEQLEQLEPLCNHVRYGKILQDAIKIWMTREPVCGSFGVSGYPLFESTKGCCLLGASLVGKENFSSSWEEITNKYFSLSKKEHHSIQYGFDGLSEDYATDIDAFSFGKRVKDIVKPIEAASLRLLLFQK